MLTDNSVDIVMMHHLSIPPSREKILPRNQNPANVLYQWGEMRLETLTKKGIDSSRIIFDPGIGFGKTPEQSFSLIQQADVFKKLGTRVLIGHSRKSFLSLFTNYPFAERDVETLAISLALIKQPVDFIRVHNVEFHSRGIKLASSILNS